MGWRKIMISNPAKLSLNHNALAIDQDHEVITIPLEDIDIVILDNPQIVLTAALLSSCAKSKVIILTVDSVHLPNSQLLPFQPHSRASNVLNLQLQLSQPLKKQLWKQIITRKIENQALALVKLGYLKGSDELFKISKTVRSGDSKNVESRASQIYFNNLFEKSTNRRTDNFINQLLNYGYSLVRSSIAKSLVSYGFLPSLGIFHHNELNSFNLADDLIEPYRPIVDHFIFNEFGLILEGKISPSDKKNLLRILTLKILMTSGVGSYNSQDLFRSVDASVVGLLRYMKGNELILTLPSMNRGML